MTSESITENITEPTVSKNTSQIKTTSNTENEDIYPHFSLCRRKDINWFNANLHFDLIYDIEGYLFLYKSIDFWIY
jgi:hypothetical protein